MPSLRNRATLATALLTGCVSIAPPVRIGQYGAPGRMQAGMVEAGVNGNYWIDPSGGAMLGYGVNDLVAVEGGGELSTNRGIGYLGARVSPLRGEGRDYAFVLDVEGGAGAGVGGQRCSSDATAPCESTAQDFRRAAGGGYLGIGVGGKIKFFYPWLRLRTQATAATGVPFTSLTTAMFGLQFSIAKLAHIYAATGVYLFANREITWSDWLPIDAGLSFTIATPRTRRLHAQQQRARLRTRP
jgi:hypothetical protein